MWTYYTMVIIIIIVYFIFSIIYYYYMHYDDEDVIGCSVAVDYGNFWLFNWLDTCQWTLKRALTGCRIRYVWRESSGSFSSVSPKLKAVESSVGSYSLRPLGDCLLSLPTLKLVRVHHFQIKSCIYRLTYCVHTVGKFRCCLQNVHSSSVQYASVFAHTVVRVRVRWTPLN
jgi:hypothetical protein